MPALSIVIVNWNSADYLRACLATIISTVRDVSYETIVIDNASDDGCLEMLRCEFPWVRAARSEKNLGFAGANNLGFALSEGRYVLFLNPDTELRGGAVEELIAVLNSGAGVGAVGAKLLNSDGSVQTSCLQAFPTILNQMLDSEPLRRRTRRTRMWGNGPLFEEHSEPADVDVISGACMMLPRNVFEMTGGFSTRYFMYSEDVDLCLRVRKLRLRVCYAGSAEVVHHGGASSSQERQSNFSCVLMRESRFRYFLEWRGAPYAVAYRGAMAVSAVVRVTAAGIAIALGTRQGARSQMLHSAGKWLAILKWALGFERWAASLAHAGVWQDANATLRVKVNG